MFGDMYLEAIARNAVPLGDWEGCCPAQTEVDYPFTFRRLPYSLFIGDVFDTYVGQVEVANIDVEDGEITFTRNGQEVVIGSHTRWRNWRRASGRQVWPKGGEQTMKN